MVRARWNWFTAASAPLQHRLVKRNLCEKTQKKLLISVTATARAKQEILLFSLLTAPIFFWVSYFILSGFGSLNIEVTSKDLAVVVNISHFGCKRKLIGLNKSKFTIVFRPFFFWSTFYIFISLLITTAVLP